jgi:TolA-binding protein
VADDDAGGGASRSTDPAAGSSAATDVSLREFLTDKINSLDRYTRAEIEALRRETHQANTNSDKAIEVAAHEAADRLTAHNGLIEQMRNQANTFSKQESYEEFKDANDKRISRLERVQSMMIGGLLLLSFLGVANLVKIWSG